MQEFQSHLSSILPILPTPSSPLSPQLSIPPWFDFALQHHAQERRLNRLSIPPWFDFAKDIAAAAARQLALSIPPWFDFAAHEYAGGANMAKLSIPPWFDFAQLVRAHPERRFVAFNPTLVRFCPAPNLFEHGAPLLFQSHLGSILPCVAAGATCHVNGFNPTLVRFCRRTKAKIMLTL